MREHIITRWGMEIDLSHEHKTTCPKCRVKYGRDASGDNLHVYGLDEDGKHMGCFCFSCGYTVPSRAWVEENGEEQDPEEFEYMKSAFNEEIHDELKKNTGTDSKNYRGIRAEISRSLGMRYEYSQESGEVAKTFYPITKDCTKKSLKDSLTGYKVRKHPKEFISPVGEVGRDSDLFLQWKFRTHKGMLLVCAGEHDAIAAYQMLYDAHVRSGSDKKYDEIAVVSGVVGEGGIAGQLRNQYEWLTQFNKIIICMDNDEAGRRAEKMIAGVLPRGKAFTMRMRYKDANEYLLEGKEKDFINDFWGHRPFTIDGVKSSFDGFFEVEEEVMRPRIILPPYMRKLQVMSGGGLLQGGTHNIVAGTHTGKTLHVRNIVYNMIMNTDIVPTVISLEETAARYNLELLQLHVGENFLFGKSGRQVVDYINSPEILEKRKELVQNEDGSPRYFLIDERSGDIKSIEEQIELMVKKHGSTVFVVDVLSDLLRGSSAEHAEDHMAFQRRMNKEGVTFINVLHTRKPPQDKEGRERKTTEYDALGSGTFVQSAHTNIVLNRDKVSEDNVARNTTEVTLAKCRGGMTGEAGMWYFDFNSFTCYDLDEWKEDNPHMFN